MSEFSFPGQSRVAVLAGLAVYGNRKIHAPNLNKLAAESIVFERAYVTQPVCTQSRASVLTGLWPHTNGCTANNIPLSERIRRWQQKTNDTVQLPGLQTP